MKLVLIRHGQTVWNAERRLQGHANADLSAAGIEQARSLAPLFDALPDGLPVFSSDLGRARHTAALVGFPAPELDRDLREMDLGRWTGRLIDEIEAEDATAYRRWRMGTYTAPGGESWDAFRRRIADALGRIVRDGGEIALVFTHEGVVRAACDILLGLASSRIAPCSPGSATILDVVPGSEAGSARLVAFNLAGAPRIFHTDALDHASV